MNRSELQDLLIQNMLDDMDLKTMTQLCYDYLDEGYAPLTCCQGSLNLRTTSGGEASRSKHFTFHLFIFEFIMSQFTFSSSAIESISDVQDGKVTITFNGGRDYTYGVQDVEMFVSQLSAVIANQQSVGRFVNNAIKSEQLVAA